MQNETAGASLELTLEKPAAGGRMIARHEGRVILVRGGIPGERVRARIERVGRGVAYGTVEAVLRPDPDRRSVTGDPACGGTVFAHVAYARQLQLKREIVEDAFARIGRFSVAAPIAIEPSRERGYRMRARFHVAGGRIGFLREASHTLCDAAATGQLSPEAAGLLDQLAATLETLPRAGVRQIDLAETIASDARALHVWLDRTRPLGADELRTLAAAAGVAGLSASPAREAPVRRIAGTPFVIDPLAAILSGISGGPGLRRHAAAFFQGNRYLLPPVVRRVVEAMAPGGVVDLYAGVGVFAVAAAAAGHGPVVAVEGDRISAMDLDANAAWFGDVIRVEHQSVEQYLRRAASRIDGTVIVDPPRTGLSREATARLTSGMARRLIYVSCDVATLARDLRAMLGAGYRIKRVEGFDLFPDTAHVELLAVLARG